MPYSMILSILTPLIVLTATLPSGATDKVYWSPGGVPIYRSNLDGTNVELIVGSGNENVHELDVDPIGGKLYWLDNMGGQASLRRANLDGSNVQTLLSLSWANGLDIDVYGGKLYWTQYTGQIYRANLDGTNVELLLDFGAPFDIALACGKMYWSDWYSGKIHRANLDGTGVEVIQTNLGDAGGLAVDFDRGKLYFTAEPGGVHGIYKCNLSGSGRELVLANQGSVDLALVVDVGKMYWCHFNVSQVLRANMDGTNVEAAVNTPNPIWVALTHETIPCGDCVQGDLNGDGLATADDIPGFITVLLRPVAATRAQWCAVDFDRNGKANGTDLLRFIERIQLDVSPPSPSPMTWEVPPTPAGTAELTMTATEASDHTPPIEYFFFWWGNGSGGNSSGWQTSHIYNDDGLAANTVYTYQVRAKDSATPPNVGAYSQPAASAATYIESPVGITFGTVTDTSIEVTADGSFTNLTLGQSGIFFEMTPPEGSGANAWLQTTTTNVTGLTPGTTYTFRVKSRNAYGVEPSSPWVGPFTQSTTGD